MRYIVNWKYASNLGGPWAAGITIDLEPDLAARINNDSPGVLSAAPPAEEDDGAAAKPRKSPRDKQAQPAESK